MSETNDCVSIQGFASFEVCILGCLKGQPSEDAHLRLPSNQLGRSRAFAVKVLMFFFFLPMKFVFKKKCKAFWDTKCPSVSFDYPSRHGVTALQMGTSKGAHPELRHSQWDQSTRKQLNQSSQSRCTAKVTLFADGE